MLRLWETGDELQISLARRLNAQAAVQVLGQGARYGEAQAAAAAALRACCVTAVEAVKEPLRLPRALFAAVAHTKDASPSLAHEAQAYDTARCGVFHGVVQQYARKLRHCLRHAAQLQPRLDFCLESQAGSLCGLGKLRSRVLYELRELQLRRLGARCAALVQPCKRQQPLGELVQPLGLAADVPAPPALPLVQLQRVGIGADYGQRRLYLMAGIRYELLLPRPSREGAMRYLKRPSRPVFSPEAAASCAYCTAPCSASLS